MKKARVLCCALVFSSCSLLFGNTSTDSETKEPKKSEPDIGKVSEALGHLIGKNLLDLGVNLDIASVVKGLKDSSNGKASPLTETDCVNAISQAQETAFKSLANSNLSEATAFLETKGKEEKVVSMEEGKLQYTITQEGQGASVEPHSTPIVSYKGTFLDGSVFSQSEEDLPLSLDETIPGLKSGLVGMKEGEKRTLYIHPDLGYGTAGMLPPNSLLTFEVEVKKAQADLPAQESAIADATPSDDKPGQHESQDLAEGDLR